MTKNQPNVFATLANQIRTHAAVWDKIHRLAKDGGTCTLTQDEANSLADWGKLSALLASIVTDAEQEATANQAAIQEKIHWHHVSITQPTDERIVRLRDKFGNQADGFYNEIMNCWQSRYPNALKSVPTHWALIKGPTSTPPLNSAS